MAIVWMLILGMLLSRVPLVKHTLGGASLAVSQIIRVGSYGAALFMVWMLSFRTTREIPDDGEGLTFLRSILRPLTAFMIVFAACKILLNIEAPFPRSATVLSMHWVISMAMALSAFWLTVAWVRHSHALIAFFEHYGGQGRHPVDRDAGTQNTHGQTSSQAIRSNSDADGTLVLSRPSLKRALGRYRIIRELGRGSMGVVYLGRTPPFIGRWPLRRCGWIRPKILIWSRKSKRASSMKPNRPDACLIPILSPFTMPGKKKILVISPWSSWKA